MNDDFPPSFPPDPSSVEPGQLPPELYSVFPGPGAGGPPTDLVNFFAYMQMSGKIQEGNIRGAWTPQEDEVLLAAVRHLGTRKWTDIARFVPTRTSKQCRERWFHRLAPNIRRDQFEPWEDEIVVARQKEYGNRWALIAAKLPGRSPCSVKNRWYSGLKHQHPVKAQLDLAALSRAHRGMEHEDGTQNDL
jgi:hypothetical protein